MGKSEFEIVNEFTNILGLPNKTDGTLFIYKSKAKKISKKPDGYYYCDGITFILDAKEENGNFIGQLEDYMKLEKNPNFVGFKYNGNDFECYVQGVFKSDEIRPKNFNHYKNKYFKILKYNDEEIVSKSAKKLANDFRNAKIDKQMNVPFIGATMLCIKNGFSIDTTSTATILNSIKRGINLFVKDTPLNRKQKKEFIKVALEDSTLKNAKDSSLYSILGEISTIYSFINISYMDRKGHDIMNNFLHVFRRWNSANAKEKGEVFTPDHIAQLMYKLAYCNKDCYIMDPTCGSGTFLTNAMFNMIFETDDQNEIKEIVENRIIGIEDNEFNATLAGINMMLHGDGASNIFKADCFDKLPENRNCYNRVLMNPPFSVSDAELKFVYTALEFMETGGILSTILPKSCLKGTITKNLKYLKKIFNICDVLSVVSLPNDLFGRNAGVGTCILTVKKTGLKNSSSTILIDLSDDGFVKKGDDRIDLNNKWRDIEKKVLDAALDKKYDEFRAVETDLSYNDEMLFEKYKSNRSLDVDGETFSKYLKENIASKILCGKDVKKLFSSPEITGKIQGWGRFKISDLICKIEKGNTKAIDRKIENKYLKNGIPLVVAKKDNNGIGGMTSNYKKIYNDKFCIVTGGDGGGGESVTI